MAHRAGARIMNAEYVQFHPTALADKKANHFLISEALRGEGARLRNQKGEYFMEKYAPALKDLAPRDVVARAIVEELTTNKEEFVYLDLANYYKGHQPIHERFPNIARACAEIGVDIERDPIPVVPAAHYFCGGILANNSGETTLARLDPLWAWLFRNRTGLLQADGEEDHVHRHHGIELQPAKTIHGRVSL